MPTLLIRFFQMEQNIPCKRDNLKISINYIKILDRINRRIYNQWNGLNPVRMNLVIINITIFLTCVFRESGAY
jgi:hypothetical protein